MKTGKLFEGMMLLTSVICMTLFGSCDKGIGEEEKKSMEPGVSDLTISDVGMFGAKLKAKVTLPEQMGMDFELGFEVSESNTFPKGATERYKVDNYNPDMTFSCELADLEVNATYYVKAYMINQMCLYTSQVKTFENVYVCPVPEKINYVDLGLSVKWAECNVGALKPEEYGYNFAWGETVPKPFYSVNNYKFWDGNLGTVRYTKYCTNSEYGEVDGKITLEECDDAAFVNWGEGCRMPTQEEFQELVDSCIWGWTTVNGVYGYEIKSKVNGNSIFLPAEENKSENWNAWYHPDHGGKYWTSSVEKEMSQYAYGLLFYNYLHSVIVNDRYAGLNVRAVCPVAVSEVRLDKQTIEITKGGKEKLEFIVRFENNYSRNWAADYWESSDTTVAKVDDNGEVTAISEGSCMIVAYYKSHSATCSVKVNQFIPEYVDLGLSVKWAKCNVGAIEPDEYGDYFAWGETEPKSDYSWSTYKYCKGSDDTMTKYCNNGGYGYNGFTDDKTVLEPEDDAARANWGGSWRMPTIGEFDELLDTANCTWTWYFNGHSEFNGVAGYKVTSKKSGYAGNWIFLPAAGYCYDTSLNLAGEHSYYWSSSLNTAFIAWGLYFGSGDRRTHLYSRHHGNSVRPVCQ